MFSAKNIFQFVHFPIPHTAAAMQARGREEKYPELGDIQAMYFSLETHILIQL